MTHRRYIAAFIVVLTLLSCVSAATFINYEDAPVIRSKIALLYEAESGKILYTKNTQQRAYPASTTKIMTALLAIENCEMDEPVTVTASALYTVPPGSSIAGLKTGEVLTMRQMLECLLVASGNDAASVIAAHVGGSVSGFVDMMNARSQELGCTNSKYTNPSGLHDEEHYTTADDLLLVTLEAMKHPVFMEIVGSRQVEIPPTNIVDKTRYFNNTNQLISNAVTQENMYSKATGIKTGHTTPAGYCLVSSAESDGTTLVSVVLGGYIDSSNGRNYSYVDPINLFLWGFSKFAYRTIVSTSDLVQELTVDLAKDQDFVLLRANQDVICYMHKGDNLEESFTKVVSVQENLTAPVYKGDVLGSMTVFLDNQVYARVDLVASNTVERSEGLFYFRQIGAFFAKPAVKGGILLLFILIVLYVAFVIVYNTRRKNALKRKRRRGLDDK